MLPNLIVCELDQDLISVELIYLLKMDVNCYGLMIFDISEYILYLQKFSHVHLVRLNNRSTEHLIVFLAK